MKVFVEQPLASPGSAKNLYSLPNTNWVMNDNDEGTSIFFIIFFLGFIRGRNVKIFLNVFKEKNIISSKVLPTGFGNNVKRPKLLLRIICSING